MMNLKTGDKVARKNNNEMIGTVMEVNYLDLEDVYIVCFEDGHATVHGIDLVKKEVKTKNDLYLERFFEEKDLNYKTYSVDHNGMKHFIDSEMIIELIQMAPNSEKNQIIHTLRKLDRLNGDIHHFLNFLAEQYVMNNY